MSRQMLTEIERVENLCAAPHLTDDRNGARNVSVPLADEAEAAKERPVPPRAAAAAGRPSERWDEV